MINSDEIRNSLSIMLDDGYYNGENYIDTKSLWIADEDVKELIDKCIEVCVCDFLKMAVGRGIDLRTYQELVKYYRQYEKEDREFTFDDVGNMIIKKAK